MAKTLHYDFANDLSLVAKVGPTLSLTRADEASVTDYNNVLKTVQSGEARFTGGRRVENLILQSEDFSTTWTANVAVVNADQTTAPDGSLTADQLIDNNSTGTGSPNVDQAVTVATSAEYTYSVYLKADQLDWAYLYVRNFTTPATGGVYFDLGTGSVGTQDTGLAGVIEDIGNGWYRCSVTFTTDAVDTTGSLRIYPAEADGDSVVDLDGTSSIFIWGAQLENVSGQDDPSPSEYQATTTAAVASWYATAQDGTAITPTGLLVEEARTNLCKYSEDFGTTWSLLGGASIALNDSELAPDGTATADKLTTVSGSRIYQIIGTSTNTYGHSVYVKAPAAGAATHIRLTTNNGAAWNTGGSTKIALATSWQRVSLVNAITTGANTQLMIGAIDETGAADADCVGDILIWGAQSELGAFPTSYIPTVAASVTRNADTVSTTDVTWYNAASGSFYAKALRSNTDAANQGRVLCIESSSADYTLIGTFAGTEFDCNINRASTNIASLNAPGVLSDSTAIQAALGYAVNDFAWYVDGIQKELDSAGDPDTGVAVDTLHIGNLGYSIQQYWNGHIAEIAYYDERLDNDTLEDLSNGIFPPEGGSAAGIGLGFGKIGMR